MNHTTVPVLISVSDTAKILDVHRKTVYKAIADGRLKAVYIAGQYRISEKSVIALLDNITDRISVTEAMALLGVGRKAIYDAISSGRLDAIYFAHRYYISRDSTLAMLDPIQYNDTEEHRHPSY